MSPAVAGGRHSTPGRSRSLGRSEPLDPVLVLGRDDRPPVGVPESRRGRIAVERDHEQPLLPSRPEQTELRRPGP